MKRLEQYLLGALIAIVFSNVFWDDFPTPPVLYGWITASSVLYGMHCLFSKALPASQRAQKVSETVRLRWRRVLGLLFLINAALCPLGLLLWYVLRFDQDFILLAQILGFLAICFASLVPVYRASRTS